MNQPQPAITPPHPVEAPAPVPPAPTIQTKEDYWKLVQNPASRLSDPAQLVRLAREAIETFKDDHYLAASAICVIAYRVLEGTHPAPQQEIDGLYHLSNATSEALTLKRGFSAVRWSLSLGMAIAALRLKQGDKDGAIALLVRNVGMLDRAIPHGQPVTNVVKSAVILLGIFKVHGLPQGKEWLLDDIVGSFFEIKGEAFAHYKYENHWVYEELSVVFRSVYAISMLAFARKKTPSLSRTQLLETFDLRIVTSPFSQLLKPAS